MSWRKTRAVAGTTTSSEKLHASKFDCAGLKVNRSGAPPSDARA